MPTGGPIWVNEALERRVRIGLAGPHSEVLRTIGTIPVRGCEYKHTLGEPIEMKR